jgi:Icc-related predicted phosphoesterase
MSIIYAGDIHGNVDAVKAIDAAAVKENTKFVIQVGDFAICWDDECKVKEYFDTRVEGPTWFTCGGNHENWDKWIELAKVENLPATKLAKDCFFVSRGEVLDIDGKLHLFLGGAESTDRHMRTEGQDWWAEETPTYEEFTQFAVALDERQPDVVVTHDAPLRVPLYRTGRDRNPTPVNLENALKVSSYSPKTWYFGHHHQYKSWKIEGTEFKCCGLNGEYFIG